MHGDITQSERQLVLNSFKKDRFQLLAATDVASRGLDIPNVDLVVQVQPPNDVETYIHRSGRTARAGKFGSCITLFDDEQMFLLEKIEQSAGITFQYRSLPNEVEIKKGETNDILLELSRFKPEHLTQFQQTAQTVLNSFGNNP